MSNSLNYDANIPLSNLFKRRRTGPRGAYGQGRACSDAAKTFLADQKYKAKLQSKYLFKIPNIFAP